MTEGCWGTWEAQEKEEWKGQRRFPEDDQQKPGSSWCWDSAWHRSPCPSRLAPLPCSPFGAVQPGRNGFVCCLLVTSTPN